jgi:glucosamine-6-phosphate deaminase
VLGLPTGSTPLHLYGHLIAAFHAGKIDFSHVHTINLDEYVGLRPNHEQSYRYFMMQNLFRFVNIPLHQTHVPNGLARDLDQECAAYEKRVASRGVDLWVVGIGSNGHVAFNEPGSSRKSKTRKVALTPETRKANARFFDSLDEVPREALTAGIATVLNYSQEIILLATGANKDRAVSEALLGPISSQMPASFLREHDNCTFYLDKQAAMTLERVVQAGKNPGSLEIEYRDS